MKNKIFYFLLISILIFSCGRKKIEKTYQKPVSVSFIGFGISGCEIGDSIKISLSANPQDKFRRAEYNFPAFVTKDTMLLSNLQGVVFDMNSFVTLCFEQKRRGNICVSHHTGFNEKIFEKGKYPDFEVFYLEEKKQAVIIYFKWNY